MGMMFQIPLVSLTDPLEKMRGNASVLGNAIFWLSFCLVGQPLAVLLYFFAWEAKYGVNSKGGVASNLGELGTKLGMTGQ